MSFVDLYTLQTLISKRDSHLRSTIDNNDEL